jgi:two-component system NtrC family sensor kinase
MRHPMAEPNGAGPDAESGPAPSPQAELRRLRSEAAFHQRLRDITVAFSGGVSAGLNFDAALQALAADINALLGAARTSVWLHQRRARRLILAASSDLSAGALAKAEADRATATIEVETGDPVAPAARGMRLEHPELSGDGPGLRLLAPLRGWRRALGTLVVERPRTGELEPGQLASLTRELCRQISAAIENIQLLDEILRQRRLLEDTFNSILDLVVVTDNELHVVQMNDAFAERTGVARADLLDRPLESLVGAELAAWAKTREFVEEGPEGDTGRFEDARLGGTFLATMTPLINAGINAGGRPTGHVLVARDITHQTRLEAEQAALRERLGQSEKLASLGQFVAGIAHEMNNPLQGVLGHLELLIETSPEARPLRRDLRRIYHEADRAAKIVRNLLVFAGSRRMARRRLRIHRVVSRALSSRAASLKRAGIEIVREQPEDLPEFIGDPLLMHQAFLNIIINAEHAILGTGQSGRIELRSWHDPVQQQLVTTVRDTGPGIPAAILPRIFDPFFTTKEVGQGTGLGLAITYGIVQEHGGTISAANPRGGGAEITLVLPVSE